MALLISYIRRDNLSVNALWGYTYRSRLFCYIRQKALPFPPDRQDQQVLQTVVMGRRQRVFSAARIYQQEILAVHIRITCNPGEQNDFPKTLGIEHWCRSVVLYRFCKLRISSKVFVFNQAVGRHRLLKCWHVLLDGRDQTYCLSCMANVEVQKCL